MTLKEAIRYKTARERKTPAVEIASKKRQDVRRNVLYEEA